MKKLFLGLFTALIVSSGAFAADQAPPKPIDSCKVQMPYGEPSVKNGNPVICRLGYILEHDPVAKIPNWVVWTLTPEHAIGCAERVDAFAADASLPSDKRATPADYAGTGYDQGHLAPNADMSYDAATARESFYMSNMSPQLPNVNRGTWKNLESAERAWVYQTKHAHTIYAGNIFSTTTKVIGPDKVFVPTDLYKIVIDDVTKKSYAFIIPNKEGIDADFTKYQVTVSAVEKASGITFPVPDDKNVKNTVIPADLKTIAEDKKKQCK